MLLSAKLRAYLLKVFDLQEDELQKTLLLQLNIFLIITVLLIVKPTINSLFLTELTASALPLGYILTAFFAIVGSYFYDKALERFSFIKVIIRTLLGSVVMLILFGLAFNLKLSHGVLMYIPYIWVAIYGLLTASQFWILANLVYNVRDAKRVFGFIGAGAIAGGIFGGYLTSLLANFISAKNILFVAALLLSACVPIVLHIWKNEVSLSNKRPISHKSKHKGESPVKLIRQSKLLTNMSLVVGISVIVAKLVDYQYNDFASILINNPEDLTAFFGFWFSTLSLVSLLIQLFLTKRIVGTFGVGNSLMWLPTGILMGSILLLLFPELWVIIFIKIIDGSFKQSVNKAATELLSIPIQIDIKKKTKTFIDVVIDSIATGMAGFILIFLIHGLNLSAIHVSFIIILLISLWLFFIFNLKKEYIIAFKNLLATPHPRAKNNSNDNIPPVSSIIETIKKVFAEGQESQVLHMLNRVLEVNDERFFKEIKQLLDHDSPRVRALAIENLYYLKTEDLSEKIATLIHDEDQEVKIDAFRYLARNLNRNNSEIIKENLNHKDDKVVNALLIALSLELHDKKSLRKLSGLRTHLNKNLKALNTLKDKEKQKDKMLAILEVIGNTPIKSLYPIIGEQLNSEDHDIVMAAIQNAAKTNEIKFLDSIIQHLSVKELRNHALEAIFSYDQPVIKELTSRVLTESIEDHEDARFIPQAIEYFNSQKAIDALVQIVDKAEYSITIEAIESLKRLKWANPKLEIKDSFVVNKILDECHVYQNILSSLHSQIILNYKSIPPKNNKLEEIEARNGLIHILEQRLDRQLHRIFAFLGIKYPPGDVDPILKIIINGPEEQRMNAIEFLDNILDMQLKKELIPIAESAFLNDPVSEDIIKKLNLKVYSEMECYRLLLGRNDAKLKHAVLYLIEQTGQKNFIPLVKLAENDSNPRVKNQAKQVAKTLLAGS